MLSGRGESSLAVLPRPGCGAQLLGLLVPPLQGRGPRDGACCSASSNATTRTVLGITDNDVASDSLELRARATTSPTPTCATRGGEFASVYGTVQLPESFLIDPSGHITADLAR